MFQPFACAQAPARELANVAGTRLLEDLRAKHQVSGSIHATFLQPHAIPVQVCVQSLCINVHMCNGHVLRHARAQVNIATPQQPGEYKAKFYTERSGGILTPKQFEPGTYYVVQGTSLSPDKFTIIFTPGDLVVRMMHPSFGAFLPQPCFSNLLLDAFQRMEAHKGTYVRICIHGSQCFVKVGGTDGTSSRHPSQAISTWFDVSSRFSEGRRCKKSGLCSAACSFLSPCLR